MNVIDRGLWWTGLAAAAAFLALLVPLHPYSGSFALKAVPAAALAALVLRNVRSRPGTLLCAGLILSGAGDVALDLDRDRFFIVGLGLFLVAHLLYIAAFAHRLGPTRSRIPFILLVVGYAVAVGALLQEVPSPKYAPVMAYLAVIAMMVIAAICVAPLTPWLVAGAVIFMFSDTVIAVNKFVQPIPHSTLLNIGLYYVGQFTIAAGFARRFSARS